MSFHKEFEGRTEQEAVEKAAEQLKVPAERIRYNVISHGSTGIFGLVGAKKARIRVTVKKADLLPDSVAQALEEFGEALKDGGGASAPSSPSALAPDKAGVHGAKGPKKKPRAKKARPPKKAGAPSDAVESCEQPALAEKDETPGEAVEQGREEGGETALASTKKKTRNRRPRKRNGKAKAGRKKENAEQASTAGASEAPQGLDDTPGDVPPGEAEPEIPAPELEEAAQRAREIVSKIVEAIADGMTSEAEATGPREVTVRVSGEDNGVLIGRRGQTLEAIQYLAERMVNREQQGRVRVRVDIGGYLERKEENLRQLALKMSSKVKKSGKPASVGTMNAHDRRIVHLALKDEEGVRTQSKGGGQIRKLVILPKKERQGNSGNGDTEEA